MIKSFRGRILTDGGGESGIERIRLSTNNGLTGYRIIAFKIIAGDPTDVAHEAVYLLYTRPPPAVIDEINFANPTLLGCGVWSNSATGANYPEDVTIVFDNTVVN